MEFVFGFIILMLAGYGGYKILDNLIDYADEKQKEKERINRMLEDYEKNKWKRNWKRDWSEF